MKKWLKRFLTDAIAEGIEIALRTMELRKLEKRIETKHNLMNMKMYQQLQSCKCQYCIKGK